MVPRSRQFSDDPLHTLSLCILVNHSTSVHTERRRAISECEPLERRRRPGGYVSLSFASDRKLLAVFVLVVDTESICLSYRAGTRETHNKLEKNRLVMPWKQGIFKRTKFQDIKCTQSIFCYGTWPFCFLACALRRKLMSFDS